MLKTFVTPLKIGKRRVVKQQFMLHTWTRFIPSTTFLISLMSAIFFASSNLVSLTVKLVCAFALGASSSSYKGILTVYITFPRRTVKRKYASFGAAAAGPAGAP